MASWDSSGCLLDDAQFVRQDCVQAGQVGVAAPRLWDVDTELGREPAVALNNCSIGQE
jgi:hypothetical protein